MPKVLPVLALVPALIAPAWAEAVKELPLERGFYVSADTPCNQASNATLTLVARSGISVAQATCTIRSIEKTGPTTFDVTDACVEIATGASFGETTTTYDIPDRTTYRFVVDGGFSGESRFCPQSDLPQPWNTNDISDLVK